MNQDKVFQKNQKQIAGIVKNVHKDVENRYNVYPCGSYCIMI